MSLQHALWPSAPIPQAVKDLITKFYACVDAPQDPSANLVLADQVFAANATFTINKRVIEGREGIVNWRGGAASGSLVQVSTHTVEKIYRLDEHGREILTTGTLYLEMKDGKSATSKYAARCRVEGVENGVLRIQEWQGWVDYVPYLQAGMLEMPRIYGQNDQK